MKKATRILSFLLALVLVFGCVSTTAFAVTPAELSGGVITDEDVKAGETDALSGVIPEANGIMTIEALNALGLKAATNNCDTVPASSWNTIGNVTAFTDVALGRTYRIIGKPDETLAENATSWQVGQDLNPGFSGFPYAMSSSDADKYKGQSFVISFDIRLDEYFANDLKCIGLYSYATANTSNAIASTSINVLTIKSNGDLYIPANGSERTDKTLDYTLPKSTVNEDRSVTKASFTTISVHVRPADNRYDVYANGVSVEKDVVFLTNDQRASIARIDKGNTYTNDSTNYTSQFDYTENDFLLGFARMFAYYNASWLKTIEGPAYSYDNLKLYYSDLYLECAKHDIAVGNHTHDEENVTATACFVCNNCRAEWNVSVPMDQTGNALCDLCEIDNAGESVVGDFHTAEEIKSYVGAAAFSIEDGSVSFDKGGISGTADENGNVYYKLGSISEEFYNTISCGDTNGGSQTLSKYNTTPYKGKSFVIQADLRLGADFLTEKQSFELFKVSSYCRNDVDDSDLESFYPVIARITGNGEITVRDGSTGSYDTVATLLKDRFTSFAVHVKTGSSANKKYGSFDVYVDGKLVKSDVQFLTETEEAYLHFDSTVDGTNIKVDGIKDYCYAFTRLFHTTANSPLTNADVLHVDNMMNYFADAYVDDYTKHDMISEHVHDYSKNCVSYGSYCELCGAGAGGMAVLDANGDNVCDVCVREQIDSKGNGIIAPDSIANYDGVEVIKQSSGSMTDPYGFNSAKNDAGCIVPVTDADTDNVYLKINSKTKTGIESYLTLTKHNSQSLVLDNFESDHGKSFVLSVDLRLEAELSATFKLFNFMSYMKPTKDDSGNVTKLSSNLQAEILMLGPDGTVKYRDGSNNSTKSTSYKLTPGADEFTTISVYVRPTEGDYGLYSIYADGRIIAEDIQFLSQTDSESIAWTFNGVTSRGVKDYMLSYVRCFMLYPTTVLTAKNGTAEDAMLSVDNPKFYYADTFVECASHAYAIGEHTHDLENQEIVISAECACGKKAEIELPIDTVGNGKCDSCGVYLLSGGAEVTRRQVVLGDMIALKLYAKIHSDLKNDPTAKVILAWGDETLEFIPADMTENDEGEYVFEVKLSSIEMATEVSMALEVDGELGNKYVTSVRDYAMSLLGTTESQYEKELVLAMLNYGAYAQEYFAEKNGDEAIAEDLANALLDEADRTLDTVTSDMLSAYRIAINGAAGDAVFTHCTLVLDSETSIKIYFTATGDFSVTVDGKAVTATSENGSYFVRIDGILPHALSNEHTASITVGGDTLTVKLSVLSAVQLLLSDASEASESFKSLGKALYFYNRMAELYTAEQTEAEVVVKDGAKGAVALVLDDGIEQAANFASEYLTKYDDVTASFALITRNLATLTKSGDEYVMSEDGKYTYTQTDEQKATTQYWLDYLAEHPQIELISHSYTHASPKDGDNYAELLGARHILQGLFGMDSEALITPGGFEKTDEYNAVKDEVYIAGRGTNASTSVLPMINTLSEFAPDKRTRLDAFMVQYNTMWLTESGAFPDATISAEDALRLDENGKADVSHVEDFIDCAMENGGLAAFCMHGIVPKTYNDGVNESGLHTYDEQADAIFAYVQKYAETGELWSATYSEAVKYFCQWNTSTLDTRRLNDGTIAISLTDKENDEMFDMELTVKVSVSDDWSSVTANFGNRTETLEIKGEAGARYVLVNVLPDSGIVTLTEA